jgi:small subunit ribosomal protein S15
MAKMHSKSRGKSKSRKPAVEIGKAPEGSISGAEIEKLILDYAKQGMPPAMIGEKMKKEHKVLYIRQSTGKRLLQILKEHKVAGELPPDLIDLMRKAVGMRAHLASNKQDMHNTLRLRRIESKIWRLTKYYRRTGVLPQSWQYDPKQAELIIKGKA